MKKLLMAFLLPILFSACSVQKKIGLDYIPANQTLLGIDFRPYAEKGFHFTPYVYQFKHTILAQMDYTITPEATLVEKKGQDGTMIKEWKQGYVDIETAIDSIYHRCIEFGADAFMNFRIEDITESHPELKYPAFIDGKRITGTAIKRED